MNTPHAIPRAGAAHHRVRSARLLLASVIACAALAPAHAANMTLSKDLLDSLNSEVDFSQSTIGSGSLAIQNTLAPGDTVFIQAHTRKRLLLKNLTQGTSSAKITVTNTGGQFIIDIPTVGDLDGKGIILGGCQHVVLRGTPSPGVYDYGIKINRTRYLDTGSYSGLKITDNGASGAALKGSFDVEVTNLEICNTGFAGIQAKCEATMPTGYIMDGINIHHNYIHNTRGEGMYLGWTSSGRHDLSNLTVAYNRLENIGWDAIQINTCVTNGRVHHNRVVGYGIDSDTAQSELNQPNYWHNEGIGGGRNELEIYNNWIEATGNLAGAGVFQQVYKNLRVYNNVMIMRGVSGDPALEPAIYLADNTNNPVQAGTTVKIMNNTILTPEGPGVKDNTSATSYYYNNIVAAPRNNSAYTTGTINNMGTYLHVPTVEEVGFVNAATGDYRLTSSSPALNTGTNVSSHGIVDDYEGVARPQGSAYDIGAFERSSGTAPAAPTGLSAVAGDAAVSLQWDAASGATSYKVKYGTTSGSYPTVIQNITSTSYTVTGLTNGVTYYFVVSAVNSNGESPNSSEVSAAPRALLISETFTSTNSNWTAVAGGTWTVTGGRLELTNPANVTPHGNLYIHNTTHAGDFEFDIDARVTDNAGSTFEDFSAIFNYVDSNNYYFASCNVTNDGATNGLFRVSSGTLTELADFATTIQPNTFYTVTVRRVGSQLTVLRGSTVVADLSVSGQPTTATRFGVGSRNDVCSFDNVFVEAVSTPPELVVSPTSVTVAEGSSAGFSVRLSAQPTSNITVTTTRTSGDSDLTVSAGGSLTFTTSNWNTNQTVTLAAAQDADTTNGTATFTVSATGLTSVAVTATENDDDNGTGLKGQYFNNKTLSGTPALTRVDSTVNFSWGSGSPDASISADNFSVRWTGKVRTTSAGGTYTFYVNSNDGNRLWVNGVQLTNRWSDGATEQSGTISLSANTQYDITLEMYEGVNTAGCVLSWKPPGGTKAVIPMASLFPAP